MKIKEIAPQHLHDYYNNKLSLGNLAVIYCVSRKTITNYFKRNELKTNWIQRKETVNHDFFNVIDTHEKAYLLGYYIADGCCTISNSRKSMTKRLQFGSNIDDIELIKFAQTNISPYSNLSYDPSKINKKTGYTTKPMVRITITSSQIFDKLTEMGYGSGKSNLNYNLPELSDELMWSLILGYFDGDGSISIHHGTRVYKSTGRIYSYTNKMINFTSKGSVFLDDINTFMNNQGIKVNKLHHDVSRDVFTLTISNTPGLLKIYEKMYTNIDGLTRKKTKFKLFYESNIKKIYNN